MHASKVLFVVDHSKAIAGNAYATDQEERPLFASPCSRLGNHEPCSVVVPDQRAYVISNLDGLTLHRCAWPAGQLGSHGAVSVRRTASMSMHGGWYLEQ
jgi:hypothetical protein